jgi:hypothetical protein
VAINDDWSLMSFNEDTKTMSTTWKQILAELKNSPTVSIPTAGRALADMSENASYRTAKAGKLGVPILEVGGKKRVRSGDVLRKLGLLEGEAN